MTTTNVLLLLLVVGVYIMACETLFFAFRALVRQRRRRATLRIANELLRRQEAEALAQELAAGDATLGSPAR